MVVAVTSFVFDWDYTIAGVIVANPTIVFVVVPVYEADVPAVVHVDV